MVSIFTYGFEVANQNFKNANCKLISLSNYDDLIDQALESSCINPGEVELLKSWRADPANWAK
jgi:orotate phosphoribosyltransferase